MKTTQRRILFIVTNTDTIGPNARACGYEFSEVAHPYLVFVASQYQVDFASILGGKPPEDGYDKNDLSNVIFRQSTGFQNLNISQRLCDVNCSDYDAVFFPGGLGPMVDMFDHPSIKDAISQFYENDRVIGAVCHGPVALLNITLSDGSNLLKGNRVAAFTTAEEIGHSEHDVPFMLDEVLAKQGAIHSQSAPFEKHVVVDKLLVTGQNPASAAGVAQAMIKQIEISPLKMDV